MIVWHDHHIWPEHAIGPPPKNNILRCNVAMHSFMHKLQYEQWGRWQDRIAWQCLSGQITSAEATKQAQIESGKKSKGRKATQKTKNLLSEITSKRNKKEVEKGTHPFLGNTLQRKRIVEGTHNFLNKEWASDRTKEQIKKGKHPFFSSKLVGLTCPYCGQYGNGMAMYRWHFNNCKFKQ